MKPVNKEPTVRHLVAWLDRPRCFLDCLSGGDEGGEGGNRQGDAGLREGPDQKDDPLLSTGGKRAL